MPAVLVRWLHIVSLVKKGQKRPIFLRIFSLFLPLFFCCFLHSKNRLFDTLKKKRRFLTKKTPIFSKKTKIFWKKTAIFLCKNERFWKSDSYKGDFFAWKRPEKVDIFGKINRRFDKIKHRFIRPKRRLIFAKRHFALPSGWKSESTQIVSERKRRPE